MATVTIGTLEIPLAIFRATLPEEERKRDLALFLKNDIKPRNVTHLPADDIVLSDQSIQTKAKEAEVELQLIEADSRLIRARILNLHKAV
jgi:hypothetical protein